MRLDGRTLLLACGWGLAAALLATGPASLAARAGSGAAPPSATRSGVAATGVFLLEINGGIGPATRDYIQRGLERATAGHAPAVVLRINTPGGLDAATRDINQAILASEVPVIAWVAPQGARAASAGTYILYACHLAAMAPATSLGAATPVALGGPGPGTAPGTAPKEKEGEARDKDSAKRDAKPPAGDDAPTRKAVNDAAAYLRSLAELRGRNADFAEAAVRDAATLTATQALSQKVVEILADDIDALLRQADGRKIQLRGGSVVLATAGQPVVTIAPDWRFKLLSVITEPTVAYLLLLVGLYGLLFEGYSPGAVFPGVVGSISLLTALYALQVLPVNYAGVALIVLGVALMTAEFAMPSYGSLGIGGLVALVVGSLILFDSDVPGFGVPGQLIIGIGAASGLAFMGAIWLAARARRQPVVTGVEELVGHVAAATRDFHGHGRVQIRGEIWQAESTVPVLRGQSVRVLALDGLVLRVAPVETADAPHRTPHGGTP